MCLLNPSSLIYNAPNYIYLQNPSYFTLSDRSDIDFASLSVDRKISKLPRPDNNLKIMSRSPKYISQEATQSFLSIVISDGWLRDS